MGLFCKLYSASLGSRLKPISWHADRTCDRSPLQLTGSNPFRQPQPVKFWQIRLLPGNPVCSKHSSYSQLSGHVQRIFKDTIVSSVVQAYPHRALGDADVMAANELAAHDSLQTWRDGSPCICHLLGGFMAQQGASAGEQVHVWIPTELSHQAFPVCLLDVQEETHCCESQHPSATASEMASGWPCLCRPIFCSIAL